MNKLFITRETIHDLTMRLVDQIEKSGEKYDYIVGIARGGLHISKQLAIILKIKHKSIRISFYDKCERAHPTLINVRSILPVASKKLLFVDDLIDKGHTIHWINTNLKNWFDYDVAVLYLNKNNKYCLEPKFYVAEKPNEWIVFPWEQALTLENKA